MKTSMANNDGDTLARVVIQPERLKIIRQLLKKSKNISELASLTDFDRATVSYHLGVLEHNKLVVSEYKMIEEPHSKGRIGRYYTIDSARLSQALDTVEKLVHSMKQS